MSIGDGDNTLSEKVVEVKKICYAVQSGDRKIRKQAFIDVQSYLSKEDLEFDNQELRNIFTETHMYLLNGVRDKTETVREQAIKFVSFLIIDRLPLNDFYLTYVFPVLVERIGTVELVEESEEIRLQLVQLLQAIILKYSGTVQLKPFLNDCVIILCETVKDKYPAIKELSCQSIIDLAIALPRDFHMQAESLVKPTLTCFTHQRYKVRVGAIKAIGEIIMHSTYKALDEAVGPLAEKLFDQIPIVRRTVAQVAARWLLLYRDRYSFFYKILPLILTGLNDEVQETRLEAQELWKEVGLQYQRENEKDLKDKLDFLTAPLKYYPENLERPNLGCRELVQRNVGKIAPALAKELMSWQEDVRVRCSQLLCSIVLLAEGGLTQHLQDLLVAMYSAARDNDLRVVVNIIQASEIMGCFIRYETWSKLILPAIEDGAHFGHLTVLAGLIKGSPQEYIVESLQDISKILANDSICCSRKKKYQIEMVKCVKIISEKYRPANTTTGYNLFKIIVVTISLRDVENTHIDGSLLNDLSKSLNLPDVQSIWCKYTGCLLSHINVDPRSWTCVSEQLCVFLTIMDECGTSFGENLELVGDILVDVLDTEADAEVRLKVFCGLADVFERKSVMFTNADDVSSFLERLIADVFVPSLVWHAGITAEAIRTMAAACLRHALTPAEGVELFVTGEILKPLFEKLVPLLLSLVEDASYRSRQLAIECLVLLKANAVSKDIWQLDDLIKIYPEFLKRLDDPTDKVRLCALRSLTPLFENAPASFKDPSFKAHHELIIDTLLTHFDDDEEVVQDLVFDVLKVMGTIDKEELQKKIERHKPLIRNQVGCDQVLEYLSRLSI